jgi:hypothetical protein
LALQHGQLAALCVDLGLRVGDLDRQLVEAVERCRVVLLELAEPVVERLQLVGDLFDLALLVADVVTERDRGAERGRRDDETSAAAAAAATAARRRGPLRMTASSVPMLRRGVESVGPVTDVRRGRRHSVARPRYAHGSARVTPDAARSSRLTPT